MNRLKPIFEANNNAHPYIPLYKPTILPRPRSTGLLRRKNLGFGRVSIVSMITVWIEVNIGLRFRFSVSGAKLQVTRRSEMAVKLSLLPLSLIHI